MPPSGVSCHEISNAVSSHLVNEWLVLHCMFDRYILLECLNLLFLTLEQNLESKDQEHCIDLRETSTNYKYFYHSKPTMIIVIIGATNAKIVPLSVDSQQLEER